MTLEEARKIAQGMTDAAITYWLYHHFQAEPGSLDGLTATDRQDLLVLELMTCPPPQPVDCEPDGWYNWGCTTRPYATT